MSLSLPFKFPLLKLPWLCIKFVIHNSDVLDMIYFATISNRTRRIVKNSKYSPEEITVYPTRCRRICFGDTLGKSEIRRTWYFMHYKYGNGAPLELQKTSEPFCTSRGFNSTGGHYLHSYTTGDTLDALKMGIEFLIDVFGCTISNVFVDDELSKFSGLGISSAKNLFINSGIPDTTNLRYLLENIKVTDQYVFNVPIGKDFYCDPQIFKCRQLYFGREYSADWVTLKILCQFDVTQLSFTSHRLTKQDIVSYVTHWFYSENRKLEWVQFEFNNPISREAVEIGHLNPMPFCGRRRSRFPLDESWTRTDMSSGMDILRQDGLLATFFVGHESILFYVWHKRFPDTA